MPDASFTLVLGGARSGKSAYAERRIEAMAGPWTYVATAQALDGEMAERIARHRSRRGEGWRTVEAPMELSAALGVIPSGQPVLVDCLTLWLTNQLLAESDIDGACALLAGTLGRPRGPWFAVANETGLGIVPDNALARRFRDEAGRLNQRLAALADQVFFMVAGLPMQVK